MLAITARPSAQLESKVKVIVELRNANTTLRDMLTSVNSVYLHCFRKLSSGKNLYFTASTILFIKMSMMGLVYHQLKHHVNHSDTGSTLHALG